MHQKLADELLKAIQAGDGETTAALLDAHPEWLAARGPDGVTAVLWAMYHGQPAIAKLFVDRGAELDLFEAAAVGNYGRVRLLIDADPAAVNSFSADGFPALGLAVFFGHAEIAHYLVDHGADVNAKSRNAMQVCPIHAAAARNDVGLIRLLLDYGADPNAKQQSGFTALDAAVQTGNAEIAELLRSRGAVA